MPTQFVHICFCACSPSVYLSLPKSCKCLSVYPPKPVYLPARLCFSISCLYIATYFFSISLLFYFCVCVLATCLQQICLYVYLLVYLSVSLLPACTGRESILYTAVWRLQWQGSNVQSSEVRLASCQPHLPQQFPHWSQPHSTHPPSTYTCMHWCILNSLQICRNCLCLYCLNIIDKYHEYHIQTFAVCN